MNFSFDYFNKMELPTLYLTKPDRSIVAPLGGAYEVELDLNFNDISNLTFKYKEKYENELGEILVDPAYESLKTKKFVYIEELEEKAWFEIVSVEKEQGSGGVYYKTITAKSLEYKLNSKNITQFNEVIQLSDLQELVGEYAYGWSLQLPLIAEDYRHIEVSDTSFYDFLVNNISNAFKVVFNFDTDLKKIICIPLSELNEKSNIYLAMDNLIEKITTKELSEEVVTALKVYGGNDLNIRTVNPSGTDVIYNFNYYKNTEYMSSGLINGLNLQESAYENAAGDYASKLDLYKAKLGEIVTAQSDLVDLKGELTALKEVKAAKIEQGLSLETVNLDITAKENAISSKESQIETLQDEAENLFQDLQAITDSLKLSNFLTSAEIEELDNFIIEGTYQDDTFVVYDNMTDEEKLEVAQELYEFGQGVLQELSQPKLEFEISAINFISLLEYKPFADELKLGNSIYVELQEGLVLEPRLMGISIKFDDLKTIDLKYTNGYRYGSSSYTFEEVMRKAISGANTISFEKEIYRDWQNNKSSVTEFIESSLDLTKNEIISSSNQDFEFGSYGLRGRRWDEGNKVFEPEQLWVTNKALSFSDDGFTSAKLALGSVPDPVNAGKTVYGLVADVLVGELLIGKSLLIENSEGTFAVDAYGVNITNLDLKLEGNGTDKKNKITISPNTGIQISKKNSETGLYTDNIFSLDDNGNINVTGKVTITGGSGISSLSDAGALASLDSVSGTYIDDESITVSKVAAGAITTTKIAADAITSSKIAANSITASEIAAGTITASEIATGTITASEIATGTITASEIAAGAITASKIAADAITSSKISVDDLSAISANLGTITAGTITSVDIDIEDDVSIGNWLTMNSNNFDAGIRWGTSTTDRAEIYVDPASKAMFLEATEIYANGDVVATEDWVTSQLTGGVEITPVFG